MSLQRSSAPGHSEALPDALRELPPTLDPSVEDDEYVGPAAELDDNFFLPFTAPTTSTTRTKSRKGAMSSCETRHHTLPANTAHDEPRATHQTRKQVRFAEDLLGESLSRSGSVSSSGSGHGDHDNDNDDDADGHHALQSQVVQQHNDDDEEEDDEEEDGGDTSERPASPDADHNLHASSHAVSSNPLDNLDAKAFAAFPRPTPPASFPFFTRHVAGGVTRVQYHSLRYGEFIRAYVGLSEKETEQAKRRGRTICMIGVSKSVRTRNTTVRTGRPFLRHSVLAVEGDAVFAELIDRAEQLYALEQERVRQSMPDAWRAEYANTTGVKVEAPSSPTAGTGKAAGVDAPYQGGPPFLWHSNPRQFSKVTEPLLRPNARCIALHYGFPSTSLSSSSPSPPPPGDAATSSSSSSSHSSQSARHAQYPRATLIAVICTSRLAENTEIYVSLESYYRCLDEAAWYARCYGQRVRQHQQQGSSPALDSDNPIDGDIYTGVKHFRRWPAGLSYFHGIGKRHASEAAEASFPFTLVDLTGTPELGEKELGVRAAEFIPYATCFLYTGPSVATQKVEKLIAGHTGSHNGENGDSESKDVAAHSGSGAKAAPRKPAAREATGSTTHTTRGSGSRKGQRATAAAPPSAEATAAADSAAAASQEDYSFVTDDTYALSLGRHGVCFGQGLARYINHRYNLSRFGNVELCSVMLSVPSEFSPVALAQKVRATAGASAAKRKAHTTTSSSTTGAASKHKKGGRKPTKTNAADVASTLRQRAGEKGKRAAAVAAISAIVDFEKDLNAPYRSDSSSSSSDSGEPSCGAPSAPGADSSVHAKVASGKRASKAGPSTMDIDDAAAMEVLMSTYKKPKHRNNRSRVTRVLFLEEQSHFVSVPFFIATADVEVGDALLAWTYGEAYDAKLERQVVAHGSLVPYADAELLNCRYTQLAAQQRAYARAALKRGRALSPGRAHMLWQRYNGDYRYALGVGDVVWRRRPVEEVVTYKVLSKQGPIPCLPQRRREWRCPSPDADLFVIVQQMRASVEKVLLKPLRRRWLPMEPLRQLLIEQDLAAYRSHAAPVSWRDRTALAESAAEATPVQPRLLLGAKVRRPRSVSQGRSAAAPPLPVPTPTTAGRQGGEDGAPVVACAERLTEAWAVFDVSLQCGPDELRECVVASTDSLALLLADVDYYIVQESATLRGLAEVTATSTTTTATAAAAAAAASSTSASAAAVAKAQHLIVNLDDVCDATDLVRSSDRALEVPPLFSGLMWPLFHRQTTNFGFECLYAADKKGPPSVKLEE